MKAKPTIKQHTYQTYNDFYFAARAFGYRDSIRDTATEQYFMKDGVKHVWVKPENNTDENSVKHV